MWLTDFKKSGPILKKTKQMINCQRVLSSLCKLKNSLVFMKKINKIKNNNTPINASSGGRAWNDGSFLQRSVKRGWMIRVWQGVRVHSLCFLQLIKDLQRSNASTFHTIDNITEKQWKSLGLSQHRPWSQPHVIIPIQPEVRTCYFRYWLVTLSLI